MCLSFAARVALQIADLVLVNTCQTRAQVAVWCALICFKPRPVSRNLYLIELRNPKFLRGAAGEDRELVQREVMLVVAAGG